MRSGDRRAAILDAAAKVFARSGYDQASMREVAREAGITTPVLYDHFASKAQLYATLVDAYADDLIASWSAGVHSDDPAELFARSIDTIFAWIERNEAGWRLLFLDSPGDPDVAAALRRKQELATAQLAGLFQRVPHLTLSADLDRDRAGQLFAEAAKWAVNAIAAWWWSHRDLTRDQIVALTTDLLWRGIQGITTEQGGAR
ncbi:TetR/AcrR family transcriptional regulator [Flindersiella endophytica]